MTGLRALNDELERRIVELCQALLPAGRRHGREYRDANSDKGGVIGDSLSICIEGAKKGAWRWYGANGPNGRSRTGGPLDLIELVKGMTRDQAIEWARETFLAGALDTSDTTKPVVDRAPPANDEERKARNRARAIAIWKGARLVERSRGEAYLNHRGVPMLHYPSVRFVPSLFHDFERLSFPALVCLVSPIIAPDVVDPLFGIWRIYLNADGTDKAPVSPDQSPRLGLGDSWGRAIWLNRPADGELRRVALCEGYETGLSCLKRWPRWTHLACMFGTNIAEVVRRLPGTVEEVMHAIDHDHEHVHKVTGQRWRPGHEYAKAVRQACLERGFRHVPVMPANEGTDFNDLDRMVAS